MTGLSGTNAADAGRVASIGPVLVIGGDGMLGRAVLARLKAQRERIAAPGLDRLDLTSRGSIGGAVAAGGWKTVINCAAYTDVDAAETDEAAARAVNADGPALLAEACAMSGARLVHVSTDYVFGGKATRPYSTDEPLSPIGVYGSTKADGERAVAAASPKNIVVRTSWLYAPWAKNFVRTMATLTRTKDTLKVVSDQRGTPTSAEHLAEVMLDLVRGGGRGIYHATDGGECTWFDLACAVCDGLGHTCDITPCTTDEFPRPAPRPAYSVLDVSKTEAARGPMPGWRDNLADVLPRLETD
ncbi:MAG: dTDP-4-dehydrorhamnose reductase [Planctomycetota bacterium]